jgi:membrane protease YdiL (CAAX protease family)
MSDPTCVENPAKTQVRLRDALMALLTWFAADTVAGLAIIAAALAVMRRTDHLNPEQIIALLPGDFTFVVTTTTVTAVVALSVLWRYTRRANPKSFAAFFPAVPGRFLYRAAVSGLAVMAVELALETGVKQGLGIPLPISVMEGAINPRSWTQLAVVFVALAVIVPFFEEVMFRGYIFGWMKRVMPLWPAIILSAAVFAAFHGLYIARGGFSGWFGTAEIFGIGVLLAWWAARTNSLRPGFAAHMVINAVSFALGFFLPGLYP